MEPRIVWAFAGALVATIINVLFNIARETIHRRWEVAVEVAEVLDFYYERIIRVIAHQESQNEDKLPALTQEELRKIAFDFGPVLVEAQKTRTKLALVYGVESGVVKEYDFLVKYLGGSYEIASSVTRSDWVVKSKDLTERRREIHRRRKLLGEELLERARPVGIVKRWYIKSCSSLLAIKQRLTKPSS